MSTQATTHQLDVYNTLKAKIHRDFDGFPVQAMVNHTYDIHVMSHTFKLTESSTYEQLLRDYKEVLTQLEKILKKDVKRHMHISLNGALDEQNQLCITLAFNQQECTSEPAHV